MANNFFSVKKGNAVVEDGFNKKADAKGRRDSLQGERPENPDNASEWTYHVSRGPDHWITKAPRR